MTVRIRFFIKLIIILSSIFLTYISCFKKNNGIRLDENPDVVKESIKRLIPVDMGIDIAESIMNKNSFKCSRMNNANFMDKDNIFYNIDFIYCDRSAGFLVSRRWQVSIVYKNQKVLDIFVSTGLIGP